MKTPLTPLEFMRRSRRLYGQREAVVDGDLRLTYEQFFRRCDRWSSALQRLGVRNGDRVAYIAPNTHAQLESFYAVPQTGAVLVPINFRLAADDFRYIVDHSGARVVCAHADQLEAVDAVRAELPGVEHFVALEGERDGWLSYEDELERTGETFVRPAIDEDDLLTINYTSGTTARPKGVMITHRNNYLNVVGTLAQIPMNAADRYLWTLPMFHANGWTFVWIVTAVGGTHVCLRRVDAAGVFAAVREEGVTMMCAAPTVLIAVANGPAELRRGTRPGVRVLTAGAPPAAATIERVEGELGWEVIHVYGLTETSPFLTLCEARPEHARLAPPERAAIKARQGVEFITAGENISSVEVEDALMRHPAVQEVAVVGLPDERWGEAPHAFVVLKAGAEADEEELRRFARERLVHFKVPKHFRFVEALPKTVTGKTQKYVLRGGGPAISRQ